MSRRYLACTRLHYKLPHFTALFHSCKLPCNRFFFVVCNTSPEKSLLVWISHVSFSVKYYNKDTNIVFIQCNRDPHRQLMHAIALVKSINSNPCVLRTLYKAGKDKFCFAKQTPMVSSKHSIVFLAFWHERIEKSVKLQIFKTPKAKIQCPCVSLSFNSELL